MAQSGRSTVRKLVLAEPAPPDEVTVVEPLSWVRARDQLAVMVRTSVAEALVPLERSLAALVRQGEAISRASQPPAAPRRPPPLPPEARPSAPTPAFALARAPTAMRAPAEAPPLAPVRTAPVSVPIPRAPVSLDDVFLDPSLDGNRRRRRLALGATALVALVFGTLLYLFVLSYLPQGTG